jgi:hypothetical protein
LGKWWFGSLISQQQPAAVHGTACTASRCFACVNICTTICIYIYVYIYIYLCTWFRKYNMHHEVYMVWSKAQWTIHKTIFLRMYIYIYHITCSLIAFCRYWASYCMLVYRLFVPEGIDIVDEWIDRRRDR